MNVVPQPQPLQPMNAPGKKEVGFVVGGQDYLLYISGLPSAKVNDLVVTQKGSRALITALDADKCEALMMDAERPGPGALMELATTGLMVPTDNAILGRMINPLGEPMDNKGEIKGEKTPLELDVVASGIHTRRIIDRQLETGIMTLDTLIPIGMGQRELFVGEPRSGKTAVILDIIMNQKGKNVYCVYASLGKPDIETKRFWAMVEKNGAAEYTTFVSATTNDPAPIIYIAASVAFQIADFLRRQNRDVVLVLDDLATHAKYLREISLLSGRVPGRESYPADVFYQHAHLMERAGRFLDQYGGGSITLLPMIEVIAENIGTLIPTNIMSSTDGHTLFSARFRSEGTYPAVEVAKSVTRVGHQTQTLLHKIISDKVHSLMAEYEALAKYSQFGSELTSSTQQTIKRGLIALELTRQEEQTSIPIFAQMVLLGLIFTPFFDDYDPDFVRANKKFIIQTVIATQEFKDITANVKDLEFAAFVQKIKDHMHLISEKLATLAGTTNSSQPDNAANQQTTPQANATTQPSQDSQQPSTESSPTTQPSAEPAKTA